MLQNASLRMLSAEHSPSFTRRLSWLIPSWSFRRNQFFNVAAETSDDGRSSRWMGDLRSNTCGSVGDRPQQGIGIWTLAHCPSGLVHSDLGRRTSIVVPWSSSLRAVIVPPWASTIVLQIDKPSPLPPSGRERDLSAR